jgi:protein-L-isoaspartate(D-aspartate) O-methyltransferase
LDKATREDQQRSAMIKNQLISRGFTDEAVLKAIGKVPRHRFVPEAWRAQAYSDGPLPIGQGQTISQPYIVALMTQLARPMSDSRVLDVGTGSGYQAAILAELVHQVYSIEIDPTLAAQSSNLLRELGYDNIQLRCGDGYLGWPEQAPFDAILVAAAPDHIPGALVDQLTIGGRLIIPVGKFSQTLMVIEKRDDGSVTQRSLGPVAFVPMTGRARRG